jgi:hypothetical protein
MRSGKAVYTRLYRFWTGGPALGQRDHVPSICTLTTRARRRSWNWERTSVLRGKRSRGLLGKFDLPRTKPLIVIELTQQFLDATHAIVAAQHVARRMSAQLHVGTGASRMPFQKTQKGPGLLCGLSCRAGGGGSFHRFYKNKTACRTKSWPGSRPAAFLSRSGQVHRSSQPIIFKTNQ